MVEEQREKVRRNHTCLKKHESSCWSQPKMEICISLHLYITFWEVGDEAEMLDKEKIRKGFKALAKEFGICLLILRTQINLAVMLFYLIWKKKKLEGANQLPTMNISFLGGFGDVKRVTGYGKREREWWRSSLLKSRIFLWQKKTSTDF